MSDVVVTITFKDVPEDSHIRDNLDDMLGNCPYEFDMLIDGVKR